ncbi:MAG: hypothetical protein WCK70_16700 [Chloroflexales bacterium]
MHQDDAPAEALRAQGIAAMRAGERTRARQLLTAAVRADPRSAEAWLWLSGTLDDPTQQRECLERVLVLDPQNVAARRGLAERGSGVGNRQQDSVPSLRPPTPIPHLPSPIPHPPPPIPRLPSPIATFLLGALGGVGVLLDWVVWRGLDADSSLGAILVMVLLAGPPLGIATLVIGGVLLRISGRGLGGVGGAGAVRAGLSWAAIPPASGLLLWAGQLTLIPRASLGGGGATPGLALAVAICWSAHALLILCSLFLALIGVAAAHRFSLWRAAATWLLATLLVLGTLVATFFGSAMLITLRGG